MPRGSGGEAEKALVAGRQPPQLDLSHAQLAQQRHLRAAPCQVTQPATAPLLVLSCLHSSVTCAAPQPDSSHSLLQPHLLSCPADAAASPAASALRRLFRQTSLPHADTNIVHFRYELSSSFAGMVSSAAGMLSVTAWQQEVETTELLPPHAIRIVYVYSDSFRVSGSR